MSGDKHLIPVVVLVEAEGADQRDAINVACATVETALTNAALVLRAHGTEYSSRLVAVQELSRAFRDGLVRFSVAS